MGRGSRGDDDVPGTGGRGGEWVRPLPREGAPGRPGPSRFERSPADPDPWDRGGQVDGGWEREYGQGDDEYDPPGYATDRPEGGGGDRGQGRYPQQYEPAYDYDRGFSGWGDRTEPGMRRGRGRGQGQGRGRGRGQGRGRAPRYREERGILPESLPFLPTMGIVLVAIILAFVLGRSTGGGDDPAASADVRTARSTTTVSSAPVTHTVQANETLSGIASQYGVTSEELATANNINNTNHVFVGQKLTIPATTAVNATTTTTRVPG